MAGRGSLTNLLEFAATVGAFIPNPWIKGISIATGVIISSIPVKRPKGMDNSQSYGWEHSANKTPSAGTPMAVIYGKTRVKPVLKNRYIAMEGDRQWLYALYSFAGHGIDQRVVPLWATTTNYAREDEVRWTAYPGRTFICKLAHRSGLVQGGWAWSIALGKYVASLVGPDQEPLEKFWRVGTGNAAITNIEINGNPITNYDPAAITYETRPGTPLQQIIKGFEVTYQNNYQGTALKPFVRTWVTGRWYQVGEIVLHGGHLYECVTTSHSDDPPDPVHWTDLGDISGVTNVNQYPSTYFTQASVSTSNGTRLLVDIYFPNGLYQIKVQSTGTKMNSNSVFVYVWCKKATEGWDKSYIANAGNIPIQKKTMKAFHWPILFDVAEGLYDIRIEYSPVYSATPNTTDYYEQTAELANVASLVYANFTYPGEPTLGIKVLATEKLQGDIEVTGVCERSLVWVHNGTAWVQLAADNHAWAIYDLLVQGSTTHPSYTPVDTDDTLPPYGCGIPYTRVDYASFKVWADMLDLLNPNPPGVALGYKLNIVFDDFMSIWEAITMIAFEGRGAVLPYGAKYYAIPDQAANPTSLLCEGNITANSLTQAWGDRSKRVNSIEVTYKNSTANYDDSTFIARTDEWFSDPTLTDAMRQTLYGTVTFAQAYRIAKYILNCNEALKLMVNLEMDVEGLNIGVGDVVNLQHTAMGLGTGGRIVGYVANGDGTSTITLDRTVTIVGGTTYGMTVRNSAGVIVTHSGADVISTGTKAWVKFATEWTNAPEPYSPYAFGVIPAVGESYMKLFRVIEVRRGEDMKKRLTLLEYSASVYDVDALPPSSLPRTNILGPGGVPTSAPETFNVAANLTLSEFTSRRPTGEYQSNITVAWTPADMARWGQWEVLFRDVDSGDPNWIGVWAAGTYSAYDKVTKDGKAYISLVDNNTGVPFSI